MNDTAQWSHGPRLVLAAGGCGHAVGSNELLPLLRGGLLPVVEAGCDGNCHAAVTVMLQRPGRPNLRWERVDRNTARRIASAAADPNGAFPLATADEGYPGQRRLLLEHVGAVDPGSLDEANSRGRYRGLAKALVMTPDDVIEEIKRSGVTGRGGAYFPLAAKWGACRAREAPRFLVVNAEEGEPGVFKDRHLLEGDPHLVIEGILIAAYAIGAAKAFVFMNGTARLAGERLVQALDEARGAGLIGERVLESRFSCEIELRWGGGGYVLGEESTLLESIEGDRPMPRVRPPFPVTYGLWGRPTVVNNVESLASVALILEHGANWFRGYGTERWPGTKLICVSGDVARPGVVEVEIGTTLGELIDSVCGGVAGGREIQAVLTGGPSGVLVPPSLLGTPLEPRNQDVFLGSGNITVLNETRSLFDAVRRLARFNAEESCGKCTPCREGVNRMREILERAAAGGLRPGDRSDLLDLCEIASSASLCGHGQMAPNPIRSALRHFALPGLPGANTGVVADGH